MNMNPERRLPRAESEFKSASEVEREIPERLRYLHEVKGEFLTRGVFFDVYTISLPDDAGEPEPFVFKDFRSGDVTMSPEKQVSLFQHQYYEWYSLRKSMGEKFFPESHWIRSSEFSDDEAHGFYSVPGKTANTMEMFVKVQLDRQLADRYSSDDKKKSAMKQVMGKIGEAVAPQHVEKPFTGAIVQKRVQGLPFAEALKRLDKSDSQYPELRENVKELIQGLRIYHDENPYGAFTWHGLGSDNVMAEVDDDGRLTGKVYIIDANFTERPYKVFKEKVVAKLERDVFEKLESAFDL